MSTVRDRLLDALDHAAGHDGNALDAPIALLWTDEARQWAGAVGQLRRDRLILTLGAYDPAIWQGPAYWLRTVISGELVVDGSPGGLPIVYLPGASRGDLRAIADIDSALAPIAGLQHRCELFGHPNGKDWTVTSLLSNPDSGLGLSVAGDQETAKGLAAGMARLLDMPVAQLAHRHIDADFVHGLLNPDPVRALLNYIGDPARARSTMDNAAWTAFLQQAEHDYRFSPERDGEVEAARLLGLAKGAWGAVWQRYREHPSDYPNIPDRLRAARPDELLPEPMSAWPQENEAKEDQLRAALLDLPNLHAAPARSTLLQLEAEHRERRNWVWSQLGEAPLANALEHIARVAELTTPAVQQATVDAIASGYASDGWRVDQAAIDAIADAPTGPARDAVAAVLDAIYRPWLHDLATALQTAIGPEANADTYAAGAAPVVADGDAVVFVDGLRLDVAHRLRGRLESVGLDTELTSSLAALPTITETAKPVLVPVDQGQLAAGDVLDARRAPDGPSAGMAVLEGLMEKARIQVLRGAETGDPSGVAWTETGEIDSRGHKLGVDLVDELDNQVDRIADRVRQLIAAGWRRITVVTDHGWLLLPNGLPKNESLPVAVTVKKKGRCARVKPGAHIDTPTVPWHWDRDVRIAVAVGITCFEKNKPYEHGGVSPQECVVPRLVVTAGAAPTSDVTLGQLLWRGLRLRALLSGLPDGATVQLRATAGDPTSVIADHVDVTQEAGQYTWFVPDDHEDEVVHVVVVDAAGAILLQRATTVGRNT
ncbi:MAG: BREX-1 system phosphatase PglZ type B [Ilumatobacteraceae bacterium]|nr:BREX-1 system phosphatase PglZ type B [Ilumatobacteraceae bacterium]